MLRRLRALEHDIPVAIVGAGAMGKGLLYQCLHTPGFRCVALADLDLEKAVHCAEAFDVPYRVVDTPPAMHAAIERSRLRSMAACMAGGVSTTR